MFRSTGKIILRNNSLVVQTDPELSRYYFNQLKQNTQEKLNKPLHEPHITIIGNKETIIKTVPEATIEFFYNPFIQFHNKYYYLHVEDSSQFVQIRIENNLEPFYDNVKGFHITIANIK